MKVATIVGARPEFIQVGPFSRAVRSKHEELLVHTGQHYDADMSKVFFEELGLPQPGENLGVGGGSHGEQTGRMLEKLDALFQREAPDWVVVFGDTNSTIAGALAATKLHIPVGHIEAGLRSYDRRMPEEVNRVLVDHVSTLLFAPTPVAVRNLAQEGIEQGVHMVGDIRVDVVDEALAQARPRLAGLRDRAGLGADEPFAVATIHRASNTDDPARLKAVMDALGRVGLKVVLPVHPRLKARLSDAALSLPSRVCAVPPTTFYETIALLDGSKLVVTDSGGLQKEAYMVGRPTITLRDTTEWVETIDAGWNRLAEPAPDSFDPAVAAAMEAPPSERPPLYGTPGVGERIVRLLEDS